MNLTNRFNLPKPFVDLVSGDDHYDRGESDYTTTELIGPATQAELKRRHKGQVTMDVADLVWSMSGSAKHHILDMIARKDPGYVSEQRLYYVVDGYKIGGQLDLYDRATQTLYDYKETKKWKFVYNDFADWEAQGNINKLLCEENGLPVTDIVYIAFLKDWSKRDPMRDRSAQPCGVATKQLPIWHRKQTLAYIRERIAAHETAKSSPVLMPCSPKERWASPDKFAVMKPGRKTSVKNHDSREDAEAHARDVGGKVEPRIGEQTRCLMYCDVAQFCAFGRSVLGL